MKIEMAPNRGGKSEAQRIWRDAMIAAGHRVLIISRGHCCEIVPFSALRR